MTAKEQRSTQHENRPNRSMGLVGQQRLKDELSGSIPFAIRELNAPGQRLPNILFHGETGAGKGAIVNWLRDELSKTANRHLPYRVINCSTSNGDLLASELFGIEKSVATGVGKRRGKIVSAKNGIISLDELDKAPSEFINSLLMWMERGEYNPVGNDEEPLESRAIVIMAMVGDPFEKYQKNEWNLDFINRFREVIEIPSLRDRADEIVPLADFFANRYVTLHYSDSAYEIEISSKLKSRIEAYNWPGNVRELENTVEMWVKNTISNITKVDNSKITLSEKLFDKNPPFLAKYEPNGNQKGYYYKPPKCLEEYDLIKLQFEKQQLEELKRISPDKDKESIRGRLKTVNKRLGANFPG